MSDESGENDILGHMRCHWDCPHCGEANEEDHDASGEDVECTHCEGKARIRECR